MKIQCYGNESQKQVTALLKNLYFFNFKKFRTLMTNILEHQH